MLNISTRTRATVVAHAALHRTRADTASALYVSVSDIDKLLTRTAQDNSVPRPQLLRLVAVGFITDVIKADPTDALIEYMLGNTPPSRQ